MSKRFWILCILCCYFFSAHAQTVTEDKTSMISLNIDTLTIDTDGVSQSLLAAEKQLQALSQVVRIASIDSAHLSPEDKQHLQLTLKELHKSSEALTHLLQTMPQQIEQFNQQLPTLAENAQQPLADFSDNLIQFQRSLSHITEQTPELIQQGESAFERTLNSISFRLIIIAIIVVLLLVLVIAASIWGINKHIIQPFSKSVVIMNSLPEQQLKAAQILQDISLRLSEADSQQALLTSSEDSQQAPDSSE